MRLNFLDFAPAADGGNAVQVALDMAHGRRLGAVGRQWQR